MNVASEPDDGSHQKAYVCRHVLRGERDVLLVSRPEGDWCFLCGGADHTDDVDSFGVVGMDHLIDRDQTLRVVLDLAPDEEAERPRVGAQWLRARLT